MSRNLGSTCCAICSGSIVLEESARPIVAGDAHVYFAEYQGMLVAAAHCYDCNAKYLAWVDTARNQRLNRGHWKRREYDDREFVDLSFRSSFNDEPGPEDLPSPEFLRAHQRDQNLREAARYRKQADELLKEAAECEANTTSYWEAYRR